LPFYSVHSDIWTSILLGSGGYRYCALFIDDFTILFLVLFELQINLKWIPIFFRLMHTLKHCLKEKSNVFSVIMENIMTMLIFISLI